MQLELKNKVAYKYAKYAVLAAVLLGVLLSAVQIFTDYQSQSIKMLKTLEALKSSSSTPATEAVWNLDEELANSVVEGLFTNSGVTKSRIVLDNGKVLVSKSKEKTSRRFSFVTGYLFGDVVKENISLSVTENGLNRVFGYLYIEYDPYEEGLSFVKRSTLILFSGIVKNLLLAVLLLVLFIRGLTRPLEKLAFSVGAIDPASSKNKMIENDPGFQGELKVIYEKLNVLVSALNVSSDARDSIQNSLNDVNISLEKKVRERTEEFKKQKEKADKASLAKTQFLATMSHEIRTPLNTIVGLSSLHTDEKSVEQISNYLSSINEAAHQLQTLLDDISDFSQIESKKIQLRNDQFSVKGLLSDVSQIFSSRIKEKNLSFELAEDPMLPTWVMGDEQRIKQVLNNLISNAIKFTNSGKVTLSCELIQENFLENTATVVFAVKDTGVGIDP